MIVPFEKRYKGKVQEKYMSSIEALKRIRNRSAEDIISSFHNSDTLPIDIRNIANQIGVDIKNVDFAKVEESVSAEKDSILGAIVCSEKLNRLCILIKDVLGESDYYKNKDEKEKEIILRRIKRFTIAHELAHAACGHIDGNSVKFRIDQKKQLSSLFKETSDDLDEYRANVFAGKLLIPDDKLKQIYEGLIYPSLEAMCNIFDVSHTVMRARLKYEKLSFMDDVN